MINRTQWPRQRTNFTCKEQQKTYFVFMRALTARLRLTSLRPVPAQFSKERGVCNDINFRSGMRLVHSRYRNSCLQEPPTGTASLLLYLLFSHPQSMTNNLNGETLIWSLSITVGKTRQNSRLQEHVAEAPHSTVDHKRETGPELAFKDPLLVMYSHHLGP